jgi:hypothetical protein
MNKKNVSRIHNGTYSVIKKNQYPIICSKMERTGEHILSEIKLSIEKQIAHVLFHM